VGPVSKRNRWQHSLILDGSGGRATVAEYSALVRVVSLRLRTTVGARLFNAVHTTGLMDAPGAVGTADVST
jgi:hypothetical protein